MPAEPADVRTATVRKRGGALNAREPGALRDSTENFNDTEKVSPGDRCLPDLLREQVQAQPDSTAVVCHNEVLTYRELAERSWALAAYLRYAGVAPDDCVGVFVEPSIDLMVGVWGVLFSGGAYLPLSPEYPEERLRHMIDESRTGIIFSQDELKPRLATLVPRGTRIITPEDVEDLAEPSAEGERRELDTGLRPNNLAYVIYTSGSSGKPKGVMIEHRSIVNQMHWLRTVHKLDQEKTVLQKTPMSFDAAQWEILAPGCGSKVIMGSPGVYRDPERLIDTIARHGVTTLQCVPTLLQALLDTEKLRECTSLTQVFSGGEVLSRPLALHCFEELPDCALVNLYGPTECTINSSACTVDREAVAAGPQTISIGAPVHNTQYHILDSHRSPVAVGEIGELYIGGAQLARGYLHRPDLTVDRFIDNPFCAGCQCKLYKTGDLAHWNVDGTVQFAGRKDNQVKLRGFRVELDEIRLAIENHDWVKHAAAVVQNDPGTGSQNLVAFVELNEKEAALMDQGDHGAHHQSKESKLQIKAQLSNMGCRDIEEIGGRKVIDLPGRSPTREQFRKVFARKTYRFFEGGEIEKSDILQLLGEKESSAGSRSLDALSFADFGEILRYFGQYLSTERLLPKYGYASPGSLYATQMYFEINGIGDLEPGYYYYHPVHHQLVLIREKFGTGTVLLKVHFMGKKRAIQPVYKNNIQEVLEIEAGHMVGLFERILPEYGLNIRDLEYSPATRDNLECVEEDYYLGTFEIVPYAAPRPDDSLDVYVQSHPGKIGDLPAGLYHYNEGDLERISDEIILKKDVIAINQQVYERSSLGITVVSNARDDWMRYIDLGRKLQSLQMKDANIGFMSSGYSSRTGKDLPSARKIESILRSCDKGVGPSYFFVGGRVSDEQRNSTGMKEDAVHMRGPTELIRDDLANLLPDYMIPNRVVVLDKLPLTANGKIDLGVLEELGRARGAVAGRPFVAPRTGTEKRIGDIWAREMKRDAVSVKDDFFESGGNSLIAVGIVNKINREFQISLPLQALFGSPTIEKIARKVDAGRVGPSSRLIQLQSEGLKGPVYCWPGLGGYAMNLRLLAGKIGIDRPFYGVQAHGINKDETPCPTIEEMAAEDVKLIRRLQPAGPYTLWGYSFGARVAFEAAYQIEQAGERVENLFLIAPGSPKIREKSEPTFGDDPTWADRKYMTILFSVFAGQIKGPALDECLKVARDEGSFVSFIHRRFERLDADLVRRIIRIVHQTYHFRYAPHEMAERVVNAPVTIFKARGDDYSFIENDSSCLSRAPTLVDLDADHYSILKDRGIDDLVRSIRCRLRVESCQQRRECAGRLGRRLTITRRVGAYRTSGGAFRGCR